MRKQVKLFLLIINFLVVFCLFSEKLYAKALHFIAYGDTRDIKDIKPTGKIPGKTQCDSEGYLGYEA